MAIDAGGVQSELILDAKRYFDTLKKAEEQMKTFEDQVRQSSTQMESSLSRVDKQYKLWETSANGVQKALYGKGKEVDSLNQKLNILGNEISDNNIKLDKAKQEYGANSKEVQELEDNILDLKIRQAELNKEMEKFSLGNRLQEAGNKMSSLGNTLTTHVTLPLVGLGVAASTVGFNFEAQMSRVKAISGATGKGFEKLEKQAMDLGAKTAFSASEAAQGMENLASAGFEVNEIMDAMPGLLDLAASSGADLATASEIAASTIRGFGMEAKDAGHVADVLARAAADTNAQIEDMGEAMKYVAPVAKAMGYNIEETAAAIGVMSDAGIKGGMAGTALRGALIRLTKPAKQAKDAMKEIGFTAYTTEGKMKSLSVITAELEEKTKGYSDEQRNAYISAIFGQEALSGMLALMEAGPGRIDSLTKSFKSADGAAKEMAETMMDNTKGAIEEMKGSLETAAITVSKVLAPMITKGAEKITEMANAFSELNPKTQETIVKVAGLVAVAGPLLSIGGKLTSGIGSIIKFFGLFNAVAGGTAAATAGVGAAATTAAGTAGVGGLAGLATGLGGVVVAAAPYLLAAAAVAGAGYVVYDQLTKETIPAIDLFADKIEYATTKVQYSGAGIGAASRNYETITTTISDATEKLVGTYIELDNGVKNALTDLYINSTQITEQNKNELIAKYQEMANTINSTLKTRQDENIANLQDFFKQSSAITDKEEADILKKTEEYYNNKKKTVEEIQAQIKAILEKAADEHRTLTDKEVEDINGLQQKMKDQAIKILSENEVESKVILERMKEYDTRITAEQSAEHIKKLNESRDKAVAAANDEYEKRIATIIKMRDEAKVISTDQADTLIADAKRQKDEIIKKAEETRMGAIEKMTQLNKDLENQVDTTTGKILTWWDKIKRWWNGWQPETKTFTATQKTNYIDNQQQVRGQNKIGNNAHGTNFFSGGWTWAGEQGRELIKLPRGSEIYSNQQSERMVSENAKNGDVIVENMNVRDDNDIKLIARELYNLQNSKRRALGVT